MNHLNWESCLNPQRNNIVFESRNQNFGAFVIRRDYGKNATLAFFVSCILMSGLLLIPFLHMLNSDQIILKNDKFDDVIQLDEILIPIDPPAAPKVKPIVQSIDKDIIPQIVKEPVVEPAPGISTVSIVTPVTGIPGSDSAAVSTVTSISVPGSAPVDKPFTLVEKMPQFPGGDVALFKYLTTHIKYPVKARINNIQGLVHISFVIDEHGKVTTASVLRGIGGDCDEEALRVVRNMPLWIPGNQSGENVSVQMSLPVNFKLR